MSVKNAAFAERFIGSAAAAAYVLKPNNLDQKMKH
jgi:hypothetical protein